MRHIKEARADARAFLFGAIGFAVSGLLGHIGGMKILAALLCCLLLLSACAQGPGQDHYYCNQRETREAYEVCMEAANSTKE